MQLKFTAFLLVTLASNALAGSLDLCDNVQSRRTEIIQLFECILSKATPELVEELQELKPKLLCTNFFIVVKKVCRNKPFTEDLYAEYNKLVRECLKGDPTSQVQPELQQPAPGLWNRFISYMKWPIVRARNVKDAIIRRFTSDKTASA
ncbi:hypothetical protein MRX96_009094 [Rhipicephalus microplus]